MIMSSMHDEIGTILVWSKERTSEWQRGRGRGSVSRGVECQGESSVSRGRTVKSVLPEYTIKMPLMTVNSLKSIREERKSRKRAKKCFWRKK